MRIDYRLHLVRLGTSVPANLEEALTGIGDTLEQVFQAAFDRGVPPGQVHIETSWAAQEDGPDAVDLDALESTAALVNSANIGAEPPIKDVCLIFANRWEGSPGVLGVMFEDAVILRRQGGFIPRQAAVVFVGAFSTFAARDGTVETEGVWHDSVRRTAVHELGHVFNLQHDLAGTSYMSQTAIASGTGSVSGLRDDDLDFLAGCAESPYVQPGGSPFGHRPGVSITSSALDRMDADARKKKHKRLTVSAHTQEFALGEPIVVTLRFSPGRGGSQPKCLDPGYEACRIYVATPRGERRLYRSLARYCTPAARLERAEELENNVTLSWSREGALFDAPGRYVVQAELDLLPGKGRATEKVVSEPYEIEVLLPRKVRRAPAALLWTPQVQRAFYLRGPRRMARDVSDRLHSYTDRRGDRGSKSFVDYVLGRSLLRRARTTGPAQRKRLLSEALARLERARERGEGSMNDLSLKSVERLLGELGSASQGPARGRRYG